MIWSRTVEQAYALVDYDNHALHLKPPEQIAPMDPAVVLGYISRNLLRLAQTLSVGELRVRLYGGWTNPFGHRTALASRVTGELDAEKGIKDGVRVLPEVAFSMLGDPSLLRGTFQPRDGSRPPRQKMVDSMIVADAIQLKEAASPSLIVFSDDEDLVPGILIASRRGREDVSWLRRRRSSYNDDLLRGRGVQLLDASRM